MLLHTDILRSSLVYHMLMHEELHAVSYKIMRVPNQPMKCKSLYAALTHSSASCDQECCLLDYTPLPCHSTEKIGEPLAISPIDCYSVHLIVVYERDSELQTAL